MNGSTEGLGAKVFVIGFHKTGTTTLGQALEILGYRVCGSRVELAVPLFEGQLDYVLNQAEEFDALQDNPWAVLYKELDERYPNSKFIFTYREEENWINSCVRYFGHRRTKMREWIYGVGSPLGNEAIYLDRYRRHNEEVKQYFKSRPSDILILKLESGLSWDPICSFLSRDIPNVEFPHANKGGVIFGGRPSRRKSLITWLKSITTELKFWLVK